MPVIIASTMRLQDNDDDTGDSDATVSALLTAYRAQKQAKQHQLESEAAKEGRSFSAPAASPGSDAIRKRTAGDQALKQQPARPMLEQRIVYCPDTSVEERQQRPRRAARPSHGARPKSAGRVSVDAPALPVVPEESQSRADSIKHDSSSSMPQQRSSAPRAAWTVHENASFLATAQASRVQQLADVPKCSIATPSQHDNHQATGSMVDTLEQYVLSGQLPPNCTAQAMAMFLEQGLHLESLTTVQVCTSVLKQLWQDCTSLAQSDHHLLLAHQLLGALSCLSLLLADRVASARESTF